MNRLIACTLLLLCAACASVEEKHGDSVAYSWCETHKGVTMWTTSVTIHEQGGSHTERLNEIHVTCNDGFEFHAKYQPK